MKVEILDGGMGTLLQASGLQPGETPEDWNVNRPDEVTRIHQAYVDAGAQVVYANTFGANPLKYQGKQTLAAVIHAALANARKANAPRVALDLGPTGHLLQPTGDLSFDAAVDAFAETIRLSLSSPSTAPDLIVIETMSDVREIKAAVIAARETCELPIWVTMSLNEEGRLLTGASIETVATLLESLHVDAYGFNCGLGPNQMLAPVKRLAQCSTKPIIVKPNAGLPTVVDGKTVFSVNPELFVADVQQLIAAGAAYVGGCCGTTPNHIQALHASIDTTPTPPLTPPKPTVVSSGTTVVELKPHQGLIIGERINPTGKKALKEAYAKGDTAYVLREAVKQVEAGAEILDVNCGVPGLDEASLLAGTVESVQSVVTCPIQVDTADPVALERALRRVNGKPLVNSVNGKQSSMDAVFPLVKKYGGVLVALCLDEAGIPDTSEGRIAIAQRILAEGQKYGFEKADFVFDALTLSVSAEPQAAIVTLETVRKLTDELGVNTVLGVSNVSFGLPNRPALNHAMYALAKRAGLSAAIANPSLIRDEIDPAAEAVLLGRDPNCAKWIAREAAKASAKSEPTPSQISEKPQQQLSLHHAIRSGLKADAACAAQEMLASGLAALEVIQEGIVPPLEAVGQGFEKGTLYLPQLLMAADAAGEAFAVVKAQMKEAPSQVAQPRTTQRPIVLATVKGDIHDIGKNIVRALLENYGFEVIDLGRDVPPERIVETARNTHAMMVGLSALMTTTVGAMAETIRQLKQSVIPCQICVGGAVVTQDYADAIGADFYAKDAMRTVRFAETLSRS